MLPRYYVPLTLKGKIALKLGFHHGLVEIFRDPCSVASETGVGTREGLEPQKKHREVNCLGHHPTYRADGARSVELRVGRWSRPCVSRTSTS